MGTVAKNGNGCGNGCEKTIDFFSCFSCKNALSLQREKEKTISQIAPFLPNKKKEEST